MAKVKSGGGLFHLRGTTEHTALCGDELDSNATEDGELTCPNCARAALQAIELTTKAERRLWRQL